MVQAKYVIYQVKVIPAPQLNVDSKYVNYFVVSRETDMEKFKKNFSALLGSNYYIVGCFTPNFENMEILFTEESDV